MNLIINILADFFIGCLIGGILFFIIKAIKEKINKNRHEKPKIKMRKRVVELSLHKEGMDSFIKIKAAAEIENFFKAAAVKENSVSSSTETSEKWTDAAGSGLKFYKKSEKLTGKVSGYGPVMDNFGNGLMDNSGRINLALLRIVGVSQGDGVTIKTDDLLGYEEARMFIEQLGAWAKRFYEENLRDQDLTASITFEV